MEDEVKAAEPEQNEGAADEQARTFTYDEVQALLQSEADKRVTAALKKADAKYQKELQKQQSLSKLDGAEREKAEQAARISELEEQLVTFRAEANKSELKSVLSSRGLSAEFADLLKIGDDAEQAQAIIDAFDKLYKAAVKAEVEKRISGATPKGNAAQGAVMTAEAFAQLPLHEQQELLRKNPEFYGKFL